MNADSAPCAGSLSLTAVIAFPLGLRSLARTPLGGTVSVWLTRTL